MPKHEPEVAAVRPFKFRLSDVGLSLKTNPETLEEIRRMEIAQIKAARSFRDFIFD